MNKIKLIVSISIIILLSGCVNEQSKMVPVSTPETSSVTPAPIQTTPRPTIPPDRRLTPTPDPTPIPPSTVLVQYSTSTKERFAFGDGYEYPKSGMVFLIFNVKITNQGYQSIISNDYTWDLSASTKDNPNTFIRMEQNFFGQWVEGIKCESAEMENGGTSSCKVAFEVPTNYDRYKFKYYLDDVGTNVKYEYQE